MRFLIFFVLILVGCGEQEKATINGDTYEDIRGFGFKDAERLRAYEKELESRRIPFKEKKVSKSVVYVITDPSYEQEVQKLNEELFGVQASEGRNIWIENEQTRGAFKQSLHRYGVKFEEGSYFGEPYITWPEEDHEKVNAVLVKMGFDPITEENIQKIRQQLN